METKSKAQVLATESFLDSHSAHALRASLAGLLPVQCPLHFTFTIAATPAFWKRVLA